MQRTTVRIWLEDFSLEIFDLIELNGQRKGADSGDKERGVGQQHGGSQCCKVGTMPEVRPDGLQIWAKERQAQSLS